MTKPIPKTARILMEARKLIDTEEKWCKGERQSVSGAMCIVGAILTVEVGDAHSNRLVAGGNTIGAIQQITLPFQVVDFNDAPSTTHADVMAVFDKAIKAEMEKG